jgi:hypothetical protein
MPIPCQGFTLTWGTATLQEVQAVEIDLYQGDLPQGRTAGAWTPNFGDVRLLGFSAANLSTNEYGKRKTLKILAPFGPASSVTLLESDCIYSGYRVDSLVNDAVRFAYTFRVQDTLGAPSNP